MRKTELVQVIAQNTKMTVKDTDMVVSSLFDVIGEQLAKASFHFSPSASYSRLGGKQCFIY